MDLNPISETAATESTPVSYGPTRYSLLGAVSFTHLLNDMMQSVIVAIYPLLKGEFNLGFFQIGVITLTFQLTASLLQPVVGMVTDRRPLPYSLPIGMCFTLSRLLLLSVAPTYPVLLLAVGLIGCGSSVFHPESSRVVTLCGSFRRSSKRGTASVSRMDRGALQQPDRLLLPLYDDQLPRLKPTHVDDHWRSEYFALSRSLSPPCCHMIAPMR